MKNIRNLSPGILLALLFVSASAAAAPARADDADDEVRSDARVISARAGRVNFVSGDVRLRRADSLETRALTPDDELKSGDTVITGAGGRVEILLNPGSYFRAGAGTEFTLAEADLDDLRVELVRGSAVIEATGYRDTELLITVATPRATVRIIRSGIYRVNALADGGAEVAVFEGRAMVGETLVKGGKRASASGVEVSKLDKKNRDELDLWSRDRGKELAKANEKLQRRAINAFFARNSFDSLFDPYGGHLRGFWFYNDRMRCYTFLPIGGYGRSPYGHWYGTGIIPYGGGGYPARRWPGGQNPTYTPPGTNGGGTASGGTPTPGITPSGGNPSRGGFTPPTPSLGDRPDRTPSTPRMDRGGGAAEAGRPRRDQP